ncbi:MAG TPA: cobalamin B12-binding domain-containing protein [Streptosporangiaceae bacterium]|jgi:DNA-binding transcriptional MerR regulator/methylmalonyl-CoA mutase cobalamin-binding subunit
MNAGDGSPMLRIGELSRRVGVSDHLLRAWESRYGLLRPVRSPGGFRLYSEADARRVRRMQAHLAAGLSAAEAAQAVLGEDGQARPDPSQGGELSRALSGVSELSGALRQALDAFDEPAAQAVLDRLVSDLSMRTVLRDIVMPFLSELGERWEQGTASIAQEHFASNVLRGRLAGLARGWGEGHGPRAVLACPPGELHDLPLMVFGIVLNRIGWRIDYYGISTPVDELMSTVAARRPDIVVLASTVSENFEPVAAQLAALAQRVPLALAGAGATPEIVAAVGATLLTGDPVTAAENIGWLQ